MSFSLRLALSLALLPALAFAQQYRATTLAGAGIYSGDGGSATAALLTPGDLAVAADGTIFVADPADLRIRKIDPLGTISTLIGLGYSGSPVDDGPASLSPISGASSISLDSSGNLYFTDEGSNRIRMVTAAGIVKTIAGNGSCGNPVTGILAIAAPLCDVEAVSVDAQDRVYFASSSRIWMVNANGTLVLIAGTGGTGATGDNGPAASAQIGYPNSIVFDAVGNLVFSDTYNFVIRRIAPDGTISKVTNVTDSSASTIRLATSATRAVYFVTGTTKVYDLTQSVVASITSPEVANSLALDRNGTFYISSTTQRVFKIAGSTVSSVAGTYPYALDSLSFGASAVRLHLNAVLTSLARDASGNLYFLELGGDLAQRIVKLTPSGALSVVPVPSRLPNTTISFNVRSIAFDPSGQMYFSTTSQVYRLDSSGSATLVAGIVPGNTLGDGGPATAATITNPTSIAFDSNGNLYIAEPFSSRIRKVTTQGIISTFAGTGQGGYDGDHGPATLARLAAPVSLAIDGTNLYVADVSAAVVRKIDLNSGIITTVAGTGTHGFSGDGGPATQAQLGGPAALAIGPSGDLYIADRNQAGAVFIPIADNNRIRRVDAKGLIASITGPTSGYNGEGVPLNGVASGGPSSLAADSQGNVYTLESSTQRVRKLSPLGSGEVVISSVNIAGGSSDIAPNGWIEIKGFNLSRADLGPLIWSTAPEFAQGRMPTQLGGVSVTVNGKPAFTYFVSPGQINVLTPVDITPGNVTIVVSTSSGSSAPFTARTRAVAPSILHFGASNYVVATHVDYSLLGPVALSVPGYTFTPARPGETITLYSVGFGLPAGALTNGASSQFGTFSASPAVRIGGVEAKVEFAGINGAPGLYQLNVVVPIATPNGDVPIVITHAGTSTPVSLLSVQK